MPEEYVYQATKEELEDSLRRQLQISLRTMTDSCEQMDIAIRSLSDACEQLYMAVRISREHAEFKRVRTTRVKRPHDL